MNICNIIYCMGKLSPRPFISACAFRYMIFIHYILYILYMYWTLFWCFIDVNRFGVCICSFTRVSYCCCLSKQNPI